MPQLRDLIDTVVIVIMENRSFDHVFGHLSYDRIMPSVRGLERPIGQAAYRNTFETGAFSPWKMQDRALGFDPPHEHDEVAVQLNRAFNGTLRMSGFVRAYYEKMRREAVAAGMTPAEAKTKVVPGTRIECMGFLSEDQVPVSSFFAQNFGVCDNWFCPVPTSTQPNKTFALCGDTPIHDTKLRLIGVGDIVIDWLKRNQVRYRVYHDGLSFFTFYPRVWDDMLDANARTFRPFESLFLDFQNAADPAFPQVVFVEPSYASAPHVGSDRPNDNHCPVPMRPGEQFLREIYVALTSNPDRWKKTALVIYSDEHGGFYDHRPPPAVGYDVMDGANLRHRFDTMGPRIPGVVVSPLVPAGVPVTGLFDHTSVLQLLAELFTPGTPYSATVEARRQAGVRNLSEAFTLPAPRAAIPPPPALPPAAPVAASSTPPSRDVMEDAFRGAARQLLADRHSDVAACLPELIHWEAMDAQP